MLIVAQKDPQKQARQPDSEGQVGAVAPEEAWQMAVEQVLYSLPRGEARRYVSEARLESFAGGVFQVEAASAYARDWLASRLCSTFARQVSPLVGRPVEVAFVYHGEDEAEPGGSASSSASATAEATAEASAEAATESTALRLEEAADSIETCLVRPGRVVAFPRYELRFLPLVGAEAFFLRLAFLQTCFLHTPPEGRGRPFDTPLENLLRWANVGRATLQRFKKGDPTRRQKPAAGWFGIEQLPYKKASLEDPQLCRFRLQQGIGLTPMDADRLRDLLCAAGIQADPPGVLRALCEKPLAEILEFPAPWPNEAQRQREAAFTTVADVVWQALSGRTYSPAERAAIQQAAAALAEHITLPQQKVLVSWYFLREWLPLLGHDAAALVVAVRARGYFNAAENSLRDEVLVPGGYAELAQAVGIRRERTIGDWLPHLYQRQAEAPGGAESQKWSEERARLEQLQKHLARFLRILPESRRKAPGGHYAFSLHAELKSEPLTPADEALRGWAYHVAAACEQRGALAHLKAWGRALAEPGTIDGWGITAARQLTDGESPGLAIDGWGILEQALNDGAGITGGGELTAGESIKGLLRLSTFWESIPDQTTSTAPGAAEGEGVVCACAEGDAWDLRRILEQNGGMNDFRRAVLAGQPRAQSLIGWLCYAYSIKGQRIHDPLGWALARLKDGVGGPGAACVCLAQRPPGEFCHLLRRHVETGVSPPDEAWRAVFDGAPLPALRDLAQVLCGLPF